MSGIIGRAQKQTTLLVVLALLVIGFAIGRHVAWTDDARFYVPAAASYGRWMERATQGLFTLDLQPWSRAATDSAFRDNHEHPPVAKYAMAIMWLVLHRALGWLDEVAACRAAVIGLWALCGGLIFRLVRRVRGTGAGLFAAFAFVSMPRVLFDGQVETLDLPVAAFILAAADAAWRSLEEPRWRTRLAAVLWFALALGTKLNAPFFLIAYVLYLVLIAPPRREGRFLRLAPLPLELGGMVLGAPLIVWAIWPWLWHDTLSRLQAYVQYHLQHYGILFYYRGALYGDEPAPWHAPWVMAGFTVPLPVLLLSFAGAALAIWALFLRARGWLRPAAGPDLLQSDAGARLALFALLQAGVQLVAVSLPGVPVYGGTKLFLAAFPFLAVLAGLAFHDLSIEIGRLAVVPRARLILLWSTAIGLLLPGAIGVWAYQGRWLSYYNELAGGARGAVASGYERQYYDLAYPELASTLRTLLPQGGSVAILPNPKEYASYFSRWQQLGELPTSIRRATPERADLLILTHERRWRTYPELQATYRTRPLLAQHSVAGVPLYSIYDLRPAQALPVP